MDSIQGRALVIGGSVAGIMAARALADHFERVSIVDRDRLSSANGRRRGVPQSRHVHVLLPWGRRAMEELLPGVTGELVDRGAIRGTTLDGVFCCMGQVMRRVDAGLEVVRASRTLLEDELRSRVLSRANIELVDGWQLSELLSRDGSRITGVRLLDPDGSGAEHEVAADLVVDATGRASRTPAWLEAIGCPPPPVDEGVGGGRIHDLRVPEPRQRRARGDHRRDQSTGRSCGHGRGRPVAGDAVGQVRRESTDGPCRVHRLRGNAADTAHPRSDPGPRTDQRCCCVAIPREPSPSVRSGGAVPGGSRGRR